VVNLKASKLSQDREINLKVTKIQDQTTIFKLKITNKKKTKLRKEKRKKRKLTQNRASILQSQTGMESLQSSPVALSL